MGLGRKKSGGGVGAALLSTALQQPVPDHIQKKREEKAKDAETKKVCLLSLGPINARSTAKYVLGRVGAFHLSSKTPECQVSLRSDRN